MSNPITPLTETELSRIMMLCGALHDLAEVARDERITSHTIIAARFQSIARNLDDIRKILENIICPEENEKE